MGKGGQHISQDQAQLNWKEIKKHVSSDDKWIVIDEQVYDISNWSRKHPGGSRVISHYAGQDASEAFKAFHPELTSVKKYLKAIRIGDLLQEDKEEIKTDFENLRQTTHKMGLYQPSLWFYLLNVGHLIVLEALAYFILSYFGNGWLPWLASLMCYSTVQAQAGWTQHDFGHLSVFKSSFWNHAFHQYTMCFTKGAAADWWNHLHYQHHAKPNVLDKDPDVRLEKIFVLGDQMAKTVAQSKKGGSMPYNWQHRYFFAIGPPLLFPVYFQFMLFRHTIKRSKWLDFAVMMGFYTKFIWLYTPLLGLQGMLFYYLMMRVIESHWFVWVSQSNHIPMEIDEDKCRPWLPLQVFATCDVEKSPFNDWFTGHLNFQIEHHLFPTMPRHNLYKVAPLCKALCEKHGIPYVVKPLKVAFADIVRKLRSSGEIWEAYYEAYHCG